MKLQHFVFEKSLKTVTERVRMQRDVAWVVEFCVSWFGQRILNTFVKAKLNLFFSNYDKRRLRALINRAHELYATLG